MLGFEKVEAAQACWYTPGRCSTAAQHQEGWSRACLKRRHLWAAGSWEAMKEEVATPCLPSSRAKWLEGRRAWGRGLARGEEVEVQAWKWGWRFVLGDFGSYYETWQEGLSWECRPADSSRWQTVQTVLPFCGCIAPWVMNDFEAATTKNRPNIQPCILL